MKPVIKIILLTYIGLSNTIAITNHTKIDKQSLTLSPIFDKIMEITRPSYPKKNVPPSKKTEQKPPQTHWTVYVILIAIILITASLITTTIIVGAIVARNSKRRVYHLPAVIVKSNDHDNKDTPSELPLLKLSPDKF